MKELIDHFKKLYEYASWFEGKENEIKTFNRPFHLSAKATPQYIKVSGRVIPKRDEGSYFTTVDEWVDTNNTDKRFRITTTTYFSLKEASEGMLMGMIASVHFVRAGEECVPLSDLCFCNERENPRVIVVLADLTVVMVYSLGRSSNKDDLYKLASLIVTRIKG